MSTKSASTTLTATQVQQAMARTQSLTSEEEKVVRMRTGAAVDRKAPLARKAAEGTEAADELLVMEMEILRAFRQHQAKLGAKKAPEARTTTEGRTKEKIVRALRKKR